MDCASSEPLPGDASVALLAAAGSTGGRICWSYGSRWHAVECATIHLHFHCRERGQDSLRTASGSREEGEPGSGTERLCPQLPPLRTSWWGTTLLIGMYGITLQSHAYTVYVPLHSPQGQACIDERAALPTPRAAAAAAAGCCPFHSRSFYLPSRRSVEQLFSPSFRLPAAPSKQSRSRSPPAQPARRGNMADEPGDAAVAQPPTDLGKSLRCCVPCRLVKSFEQFYEQVSGPFGSSSGEIALLKLRRAAVHFCPCRRRRRLPPLALQPSHAAACRAARTAPT